MTIFDIGLFIGVTIALTVLQFALARAPLWVFRRLSVEGYAVLIGSHLAAAGLLFFLMLPADIAEAVRWLALAAAFLTGLSIDLLRLRPRRRDFRASTRRGSKEVSL
jgi:hypothetical protein